MADVKQALQIPQLLELLLTVSTISSISYYYCVSSSFISLKWKLLTWNKSSTSHISLFSSSSLRLSSNMSLVVLYDEYYQPWTLGYLYASIKVTPNFSWLHKYRERKGKLLPKNEEISGWSRKASVIVKIFHSSFWVFDLHPVISSLFGKSFPFLSLFFVLSILWYFPFQVFSFSWLVIFVVIYSHGINTI